MKTIKSVTIQLKEDNRLIEEIWLRIRKTTTKKHILKILKEFVENRIDL